MDYSIWEELCGQMSWNKITNKKTLIEQIHLGLKKIRPEVVRCSIDDWTKRIYRMLKNNGDYVF